MAIVTWPFITEHVFRLSSLWACIGQELVDELAIICSINKYPRSNCARKKERIILSPLSPFFLFIIILILRGEELSEFWMS